MLQTVVTLILTSFAVSELFASVEPGDCNKTLEDVRTYFNRNGTELNETATCQELLQVVTTSQCLCDVSFRHMSFEFITNFTKCDFEEKFNQSDCNNTFEDSGTNFNSTISNETDVCQEAIQILTDLKTSQCLCDASFRVISLQLMNFMGQANFTNCDFEESFNQSDCNKTLEDSLVDFSSNFTELNLTDACLEAMQIMANLNTTKCMSDVSFSMMSLEFMDFMQQLIANNFTNCEFEGKFNQSVITEPEVHAITSGCNASITDDSKAKFEVAMKTLNETIICSTASDSLSIVKKLQCLSDTRFRLYYLGFTNKLEAKNYSCDLESKFYPIESDDCTAATQKCMIEYVDHIEPIYKNSSFNPFFCRMLSDYIDCLKFNKGCSVNASQIKYDEERDSSNATCVIPLLSSEVRREDCYDFIKQCLSPLDRYPAQNFCPNLKKAISCTVRGKCASDVELRIRHVTDIQGFNDTTCDTSDSFPTDCKACLFKYVDNIMSINETDSTQRCSTLDEYMKCQLDQCGKNKEKLMTTANEEIKRLNLTDCAIRSMKSDGLQLTASFISVTATIIVAMAMRHVNAML